jgi:hypothetical protein
MPRELDEQGQALLRLLVERLQRPDLQGDEIFIGYKQVHEELSLRQMGGGWGASLQQQGMANLSSWLSDYGYPAIDGLVVSRSDGNRPGAGYFDDDAAGRNRSIRSDENWKAEIAKARIHPWTPYLAADASGISAKNAIDHSSGRKGSAQRAARDRDVARIMSLLSNRVKQSDTLRETVAPTRTISPEMQGWLEDQFAEIPVLCALCGAEITLEWKNELLKPSVDRIDSECIDYKPENVELVHYACNLAKNKFNQADFAEWLGIVRGCPGSI